MSEQRDGELSDVGRLDPEAAGNDPISPEDATSGYPASESGEPEEGTAGPNARPRDDEPGREPDADA
jgi:hypothetical protein